MIKKKILIPMVAAAIVTSISVSGNAYAATNDDIVGMVSAINSTDIILLSKDDTTYTIHTTDAKIVNANSVSDIKNGDLLIVQGKIEGSSVEASTILDSRLFNTIPEASVILSGKFSSSQAVKNEGIEGVVTALNGNIITITDPESTSYTVDASNAKVLKDFASIVSSVSDIHIGDKIIVR